MTVTFTLMLAVLLALMRYRKIVAGIALGIICFVIVAALGSGHCVGERGFFSMISPGPNLAKNPAIGPICAGTQE